MVEQKENLLIKEAERSASTNILFISSYVPRKCGIATFTRDLIEGMKASDEPLNLEVAAMADEESENLKYPQEVKVVIRQKRWIDYRRLSKIVNSSKDLDLVVVQHEYGIFGGMTGDFIVRFMDSINKPIIAVLHTVMPDPSPDKVKVLGSVCQASEKVVVMLNQGAEVLENTYGVDREKIVVIPHGVPDFKPTGKGRKIDSESRVIMSSINLLSSVKGLEYAIASLPEITKEVPGFIYRIIGETHPANLRSTRGHDLYRRSLENLARKLKVEHNVEFVNRYISVPELVSYIKMSDFYITPYLDPQQSTSGALAYALGAGKACISTPYPYAKEMLSKGAGVIVPFKDPESIAETVINLIKNPDQRKLIERNAAKIGAQMDWKTVGGRYLQLINSIISPKIPGYPLPKNEYGADAGRYLLLDER